MKMKKEDEMKITQPEPGGTQKKGLERENTPTHLTRSRRTLKGQEKRKTEAEGKDQDPQAEGG